jgi:hypothetical protein
MRMKNCEYAKCSKPFEPASDRAKYCSQECRINAFLDRRYIPRKHPKRVRDRKRERLQRKIMSKVALWRLEKLEALYGDKLPAKFDAWVDHMILVNHT